MRKLMIAIIAAAVGMTGVAFAAETITYSYDAKGRLVKEVRTGTINNKVVTDFEHDKANNRKRRKVVNPNILVQS
jgi:hypothetical protein